MMAHLHSSESDKERDNGKYIKYVHDVTAEAALGWTRDETQ